MTHLPTLGSPSALLTLPSSVTANLSLKVPETAATGPANFRGFVTKDTQLAVIYQGNHLEVIRCKTNERLASKTFGENTNNGDGDKSPSQEFGSPSKNTFSGNEITCACEVNTGCSIESNDHDFNSNGNTSGRWILVGLASGLVCLLDLRGSSITRTINIGQRVTSVEVVSTIGGSLADQRAILEELMFFRGIIAVGTQEGHLYLVDLALDHLESASPSSKPNPLHFLANDKKQCSQVNIADLRQYVMQKGHNLALSLNERAFVNNAFKHFSSITGESTYFPQEGVSVCSLKFLPHLASLAVGFNFGCWQLWNLANLNLDFSSNYNGADSLPVIDFTFQEPENDPRNFCYVWTIQSDFDFDLLIERLQVFSKAAISLHALSYQTRDYGDQYGVLYSGLQSCTKRFEHTLDGSPSEKEAIGSVALCSATLGLSPNPFLPSSLAATQPGFASLNVSDPESFVSNLGLAVFLWEVHKGSGPGCLTQPDYFCGIFDLNAWYQSQMPMVVNPAEMIASPDTDFAQCPFFTICSLEEIIASASQEMSDFGLQIIYNFGIDLNSVSRYQSLTNVEQHFYPSSLAFDLTCGLNSGFVQASNLGLQRKVLLELQTRGRSDLVQPHNLFQLCILAGLTSDLPQSNSDVLNLPVVEMRRQILTVALENHLVRFLTSCVTYWKDGKFSSAGCTLKFLLDWCWSKITQLKETIDRATMPLFDFSCMDLNELTRKTLLQNSQQLKHLSSLMETLIEHNGILSNIEEMDTKYSVCKLINQYLEVMLWFLSAGLLPEIPEDNFANPRHSNSPYPYSLLASTYHDKRTKMTGLVSKLASELSVPCLLIDGLCNDLGDVLKSNFERYGGDGAYPPPSLHSLLSVFLVHASLTGHEEELGNQIEFCKYRIVQYLFLDIASCLEGEKWVGLIENLIKFPSAFSLPPSLIKLTQAFWLLDHEDFEEAIAMLLDPLIKDGDISSSQHRAILLSFLVQDQAKLALKYSRIRKPPQQDLIDVQLHIAVLLANGMVYEAFQYQRMRGNTSNSSFLMRYCFERAEELGKLDSVLQLLLTTKEEEELVNFLKMSLKPRSQEVLLLYYLQRSRYNEAMILNEQLNTRTEGRERSGVRQAIMNRYSSLIPNSLMNRFSNPRNISERLKLKSSHITSVVPLSVEMRAGGIDPVFHASVIREEMEKKRRELDQVARTDYSSFSSRWAKSPAEIYSGNQSRQVLSFPKDVSLNESSFMCAQDDSDVIDTTPKAKRKSDFPWISASGMKKLNETKKEILAFLETPKIEKRRKSMGAGGSVKGKRRSLATPHSILKIKRLVSVEQRTAHDSPLFREDIAKALDMSKADSEDENWLVETSNKKSDRVDQLRREETSSPSRSRESTPNKSLRFSVPKKYPEFDIDMDEVEGPPSKSSEPNKTTSMEMKHDSKQKASPKAGKTPDVDGKEKTQQTMDTEEDKIENEKEVDRSVASKISEKDLSVTSESSPKSFKSITSPSVSSPPNSRKEKSIDLSASKDELYESFQSPEKPSYLPSVEKSKTPPSAQYSYTQILVEKQPTQADPSEKNKEIQLENITEKDFPKLEPDVKSDIDMMETSPKKVPQASPIKTPPVSDKKSKKSVSASSAQQNTPTKMRTRSSTSQSSPSDTSIAIKTSPRKSSSPSTSKGTGSKVPEGDSECSEESAQKTEELPRDDGKKTSKSSKRQRSLSPQQAEEGPPKETTRSPEASKSPSAKKTRKSVSLTNTSQRLLESPRKETADEKTAPDQTSSVTEEEPMGTRTTSSKKRKSVSMSSAATPTRASSRIRKLSEASHAEKSPQQNISTSLEKKTPQKEASSSNEYKRSPKLNSESKGEKETPEKESIASPEKKTLSTRKKKSTSMTSATPSSQAKGSTRRTRSTSYTATSARKTTKGEELPEESESSKSPKKGAKKRSVSVSSVSPSSNTSVNSGSAAKKRRFSETTPTRSSLRLALKASQDEEQEEEEAAAHQSTERKRRTRSSSSTTSNRESPPKSTRRTRSTSQSETPKQKTTGTPRGKKSTPNPKSGKTSRKKVAVPDLETVDEKAEAEDRASPVKKVLEFSEAPSFPGGLSPVQEEEDTVVKEESSPPIKPVRTRRTRSSASVSIDAKKSSSPKATPKPSKPRKSVSDTSASRQRRTLRSDTASEKDVSELPDIEEEVPNEPEADPPRQSSRRSKRVPKQQMTKFKLWKK